MNLLRLSLPVLALALYGLNATFTRPRIELFMALGWGATLLALLVAYATYRHSNSFATHIGSIAVLAMMSGCAIYSFTVGLAQLRSSPLLAIRHIGMLVVVGCALYFSY